MDDAISGTLARRDVLFHIHSQTNPTRHAEVGPFVATHGEGPYVFDTAGRRYIDAMAGLWCTSLGFSNRRLIDAATAQFARFGFFHTFNHKTSDVAIELAEDLAALSPIPDSRIYYATSGSEATETMVKLAWLYHAARGKPGKRKIIARLRGFHGSTIAAASMTGIPRLHREFGLPLPGFLHTLCPDYYRDGLPGESEPAFVARLAQALEDMILAEGPGTIAAFIAEPINAGGGIVVPPEGYFAAIQAVLAKYDILCLDDEVVCGFGRTGNWFGCQTVGMKPDMIAVAKGLSSSYFPISAVMVGEPVYQAIVDFNRKGEVFGHGFTNSGHPVGCAVAREAIAIYREMDVVSHSRRMGARLMDRLHAIASRSRIVGQVRGRGLMIAVELVCDPATRTLFPAEARVGARFDERAMGNGLIIRAMGDIIGFCPPLIVDESHVDEMAERFEQVLVDLERDLALAM